MYQALLRRDGGRCHYCECYLESDGNRSMTIDHKVPLVSGGDNDLRNLVLACYACNNHKGDMTYEAYRASKYLADRRTSILGQILAHHHEAISFNRNGNWSCLCGECGTAQDDPKSTGCTLFSYGAFYQP
jgi:hypothetical protein